VVYQIYVRSFGDGTGDIAGMRPCLGYLRDLGVDAVWIDGRNPDEAEPPNDPIARRWRRVLDEYDDRMMVAEAWVAVERRPLYLRPDENHQAFDFDRSRCPARCTSTRAMNSGCRKRGSCRSMCCKIRSGTIRITR